MNLTTGLTSINLGYFDYVTEFSLLEETTASRIYPEITNLISIKIHQYSLPILMVWKWIRIAFEINQENANDGASVLLESLKNYLQTYVYTFHRKWFRG